MYWQKIYLRLWDSPTATTWLSFLSKSFNVTLIMPLVLNRLETSDVNLWYLFISLLSLQLLLDAGFGSAFVRIIAYGTVGLRNFSELGTRKVIEQNGKFDEEFIGTANEVMSQIYKYLCAASMLLLITAGSWTMKDSINGSSNAEMGWICWIFFVITFPIILWGNVYINLLQGTKNIPLVRRWDTLFNLLGTLSTVILLLTTSNVYFLIIVNQIWLLTATYRNARLVRNKYAFLQNEFSDNRLKKDIKANVLPSAWKSGLGILMSQGIIQSSTFIMAKLATPTDLASYLVGLSLIQNIRNFSQAPFYSRLPEFATLMGQGDIIGLGKIAQKNMNMVYYIFCFAFISLAYLHGPLFNVVKSNVNFPDPILWGLLGLAFLIDRYGAMHLQIYSTTNHIIWHYLNGITGVLMILSSILLYPHMKIYAFPFAMLCSYLLCYSWYAPYKSYNLLKVDFFSFERRGFIPCVLLILFVIIFQYHSNQ